MSSSRAAKVAWPRQVAIFLSRDLTDASLQAIGEAFDRNHATVVHACRRVSDRLLKSPDEAAAVRELTTLLSMNNADRDY
jgi:chromosomal replication initiator protein